MFQACNKRWQRPGERRRRGQKVAKGEREARCPWDLRKFKTELKIRQEDARLKIKYKLTDEVDAESREQRSRALTQAILITVSFRVPRFCRHDCARVYTNETGR